jgi:hypothetical protein
MTVFSASVLKSDVPQAASLLGKVVSVSASMCGGSGGSAPPHADY